MAALEATEWFPLWGSDFQFLRKLKRGGSFCMFVLHLTGLLGSPSEREAEKGGKLESPELQGGVNVECGFTDFTW